jgi:hypothetical protein
MPEKIARRLARRMAQLEKAAEGFELEVKYTEREVNDILSVYFDDHVFARRLLVEWGFIDRESDGSSYWRLK